MTETCQLDADDKDAIKKASPPAVCLDCHQPSLGPLRRWLPHHRRQSRYPSHRYLRSPRWRDALAHVVVGTQWTSNASWETVKNESLFVTSWMDVLRDIAPDSGAYMSEGDLLDPNQQQFYGDNYDRLYCLKQRYDTWGLFFALTAVGAEDWEVQVTDPVPYSWNNNGRLCPVS